MPSPQQAARAYAATAGLRSLREQEADVFLRVNTALRHARAEDGVVKTRAVADAERLWGTVIDLVRDPANALPDALKAAIVSVGLAVQRELRRPVPDFDFIIGVNANIAAGLGARA